MTSNRRGAEQSRRTFYTALMSVSCLFAAPAVEAQPVPRGDRAPLTSTAFEQKKLGLVPLPVRAEPRHGSFRVTPATRIEADRTSKDIGKLLSRSLAPALGFSLPVNEAVSRRDRETTIPIISVRVDKSLSRLGAEGYELEVYGPSRVEIRAAAAAGAFYGTQTLRQLLPAGAFAPIPAGRELEIPGVWIEDRPRFAWRGLMIDTARYFLPKTEVLRFIDLLALHKLNVLHLHLTDDQGWRVEIRKYPLLTSVGARRAESPLLRPEGGRSSDGTPHGGFYTQDDIREIVAYAKERFITVVPEIDMPGHAQAAVAAYPEIGVSDKPVSVASEWGVFPYLFSPDEKTIGFLSDVLNELMDVFPSRYIHLGGDEAIKDQWKASPKVQAQMRALGLKDEHALQGWFTARMEKVLAKRGRRLIGWDEILDGGAPKNSVVMSWRGAGPGVRAASLGHDVIMIPNSHVYLDYYQSNDPGEPRAIGGYIPLSRTYSFNPTQDIAEPAADRILGAQAALWREYIPTAEHLQYMAFPRTAALAEAVWTPSNLKNFEAFRERLSVHEERLQAMGIRYRSVSTWSQEEGFRKR